jgi:hypothetical protein
MSKSPLLALSLAILLLAPAWGESGPLPYQATIQGMGDRSENLSGERAFLSFAEEKAAQWGYQTERLALNSSGLRYSLSENLICTLNADSDSARHLYLAVPVMDPQPAQQRGAGPQGGLAFNQALAMGLMESLSKAGAPKPKIALSFIFLGAERSTDDGQGGNPLALGSAALAERLADEPGASVLYLSFTAPSAKLTLRNAAAADYAPSWLAKDLWDSLRQNGFYPEFSDNRGFFLPNERRPGDALATLLKGDVAAVALAEGESAYQATARNSLSPPEFEARLAAAVTSLAGAVAGESSTPNELHYLLVQAGKKIFVLHEDVLIGFLIGSILFLFILVLAASIWARDSFALFFNGFLRHLPRLVLAFLITAGLHLASVFIVHGMLVLRGGTDYWQTSPGAFVGLSLGIFFALLFVAAYFLFNLGFLPSSISFYGAGAALLLFIDVFVFATLHLYYALFFVFLTLGAAVAIIFRGKISALVCLGVSLLPLALAATNASEYTVGKILGLLLQPSSSISLFLAFVCLPILFLGFRCILIFNRNLVPVWRRSANVSVIAAVALAAFLSFCPLVFGGHSARKPIPLKVEVVSPINARPRLQVQGGDRLRGIDLVLRGQYFPLGSKATASLDLLGTRLLNAEKAELSTRRFLGRKQCTLTLSSQRPPAFVRARLKVKDEFDLLDCNYPYAFSEADSSCEISVPANPPAPLSLNLTLADTYSGQLELETVYAESEARASGPAQVVSCVTRQFSRAEVR